MSADQIAPETIKQVGFILEEIAQLMSVVRELSMDITANGRENFNGHLPEAIRHLANQAGWLADMAGDKIGAGGVVGGPENWMLQESYARLTEPTAAAPEVRPNDSD